MTDDVALAATAIRAGELVVIPTDTVYGLACNVSGEEPARRLYALKGRTAIQPTALVASGFQILLDCVPELRGRAGVAMQTLLPGPYTLVLPNPARRYEWLNGERRDTIGVRVPDLAGPGLAVLQAVGVVAATSANLAGGADPRRAADVAAEIRAGVAIVVDGGELPGTASTVIDLTGHEPVVLRDGAGDAASAVARLRVALDG